MANQNMAPSWRSWLMCTQELVRTGLEISMLYIFFDTDDKIKKFLFFPSAFFIGCYFTGFVEKRQIHELSPSDTAPRNQNEADRVEVDGVDEEEQLTQRNLQRKMQEEREKDEAHRVVKGYFGPTTSVEHLPDMGSRLQKTWTRVGLIVASPMAPKSYKLDAESLEIVNRILRGLKHPHVLPVLSIEYLTESSKFLIIAQWEQVSSLRDLLYDQHDPTLDWSDKYAPYQATPLSKKDVASCGRQILEGMAYLYDQGFPFLGHIQSGNIFACMVNEEVEEVASVKAKEDTVDESTSQGNTCRKIFCRVGGYENMLLGYRTCLYGALANHDLIDRIDLVMFGHVIYEITCGQELSGPFPEEGDYNAVYDKEVRDVLRYIFDLQVEDNNHKSALAKIMALDLFKSAELPSSSLTSVPLSNKLKDKFQNILKQHFLGGVSAKGMSVITEKLKDRLNIFVDRFRK